jgi:hypothetical protein
VANHKLSRARQVVQASAMTLPAVGMKIYNVRSYLPGSFAGCITVQRIMAALVVVEILEINKFPLQIASIPKRLSLLNIRPR